MRTTTIFFLVIGFSTNSFAGETDGESGKPVKKAKRPVFPILKAHNWPAKKLAAFDHYAGSNKPPVPLVAYGYSTADRYVFITKKDLESRPLTEVRKEAQANIDKYDKAKWTKVDGRFLTASGTDFSAEKILCKAFLIEAQKKLGAKRILVGIPRRTVIYAVNAEAADKDMQLFLALFHRTWKDDSHGHAKITNLLFRFSDGKLIGAVRPRVRD